MSDSPKPDSRTINAASGAEAETLRRFDAACAAVEEGAPLPPIDDFLGNTSEPARGKLRQALERIAHAYRRMGGDTVEYQGGASSLRDGTPPLPGRETGEYVEGAAESNRSAHDGKGGEFPRVPGYEITGVLGRGGMGVVYQARQRGLDRLVALKMILGGGHADVERRQRFVAEAQNVAALQHPHIVHIYEVGEHEGLPFFSLEFVDGGSLATQIQGKPQHPRAAARLLKTVAEAMEFAHQRGIVHRDLKPANILLAKTASSTESLGSRSTHGSRTAQASRPAAAPSEDEKLSQFSPKVADFGLAKRLEGDSGQTRSGIVLGSPSYMAPEQAFGTSRDRPVGPTADVYALGAILYELLTGRPPFQGATVLETLGYVKTEEPVPPRQLQPSTPIDLETISLKCLQKDPEKRYATAQTCADDLQRFLNGEPILARPVGGLERAVRWCRRNPRIAALTALVFLLLTTVAVTSTVFAFRLKEERDNTEEARGHLEKTAKAEAKARREAEENAKVAMDQARLALDLVYNQVTYVHTELRDRANVPTKLLQRLLEDALGGLDGVMKRADNTGLEQRTRAGVHQRMGDLFLALGRPSEAKQQYEKCHALVQDLVQRFPNDPLALRAMGIVLSKQAEMASGTQALELHERSLNARKARLTQEPGAPDALAQMALGHGALGKLALASGHPDKALKHYGDELSWRDQYAKAATEDTIMLRERAAMYDKLGEASSKLGHHSEMRNYFARARELRTELLAKDPDNPHLQDDQALSALSEGDMCLLQMKDYPAASAHYEEAVRLRQGLRKASPESLECRRRLGYAYYRLGASYLATQDHAKADEAFANAVAEFEFLVNAKVPRSQTPYMLALARCGRHGEAAVIADRIRGLATAIPEQFVFGAGGYAHCLAALKHPKASPPPDADSSALAERYTAGALECLARAVKAGWKDAVSLEQDPDLEPIRQHPQFVLLIEELKRGKSR